MQRRGANQKMRFRFLRGEQQCVPFFLYCLFGLVVRLLRNIFGDLWRDMMDHSTSQIHHRKFVFTLKLFCLPHRFVLERMMSSREHSL